MINKMLSIEDEAINYNQAFGFNVLPMAGKEPLDEWMQWQDRRQSIDDVLKFDWKNKILGVAAICGLDNLICLDLDQVESLQILDRILELLKLPKDYEWIVRTKSGYHIWVVVCDISNLFKYLGRKFAYKKFYPKELKLLKHIELRVERCYVVLPPSKHPEGGSYYFLNQKPTEKPTQIEVDNIFYMLGELFNPVNRHLVLSSGSKWKPDLKYLPAAIKHLKGFRLGYDIWRDCCFALSSLGEHGREHFRELSDNNFYTEDNIEIVDKQFDECLKRYDSNWIKLNTLFFYAKDFGFVYGRKRDKMSKIIFTYPLSIMQCEDEKLVDRFISFGLIRIKQDELEQGSNPKRITREEIQQFLDKNEIKFLTPKDVMDIYLEVDQAKTDFEIKYGTDAYGLIGLDFLLDCKKGLFNIMSLRSYAAVKAVLGRTAKFKWIAYSRLMYAYKGYKSEELYNQINAYEGLVCRKTLQRNLIKLKNRGFLSMFYYGRRTYFSTYLNQEKLKYYVMKRILEKDKEKHKRSDAQFRTIIREERKKLKLKRLN